jgi:DUF2911 family protein
MEVSIMPRTRLLLASCLGFSLLIFAASRLSAHGNAKGESKATIGSATVWISYGRPALKGRDMLKQITPGQIWRLGADVPTLIASDHDLDFGGTRVPKGKHILLARLDSPGHWVLIVSSKTAREFQQDPTAHLAEVPMQVQDSPDSTELLTITVTARDGGGVIDIAWGTSRLEAAFKPAE